MKVCTALILISMMISVSVIASPALPHETSVGVREGDWIEYNISVTGIGTPPPTHDVRWMRIEVLPVQDIAFNVNLTARYLNGTVGSAIWKFNFTEGNVEGWIVIPSNLGPGDTFYDSSPHTKKPVNVTIQRQEQKTVLGATRTVTYGNDSFRHKEWDKATGVFVGASEVYKNVTNKDGWYIDNLTVTVEAVATNMWSPELVPGLDQTVFFALVAASAVLVASAVCSLIVVTRRKKLKKIISRSTSRGKITVFAIIIMVALAWAGAFALTNSGMSSHEINLAMQTFWTALVMVSMWFRMKGNYLVHEISMILVVFSALISFTGVLLMSPPGSSSLDMYFSSPLNLAAFISHAFFSIPALAFGALLVALWRPGSITFAAKSKTIARITTASWVLSYIAGIFSFVVYHTTLFG
jgi:hypothetical protein